MVGKAPRRPSIPAAAAADKRGEEYHDDDDDDIEQTVLVSATTSFCLDDVAAADAAGPTCSSGSRKTIRKKKAQSADQRRASQARFIANKREDRVFRVTERERDRLARAVWRSDPSNLLTESQSRAIDRLNPHRRDTERVADSLARQLKRHSAEWLIARYEKGINEGPNYVCVCCGGLFFRRSVITWVATRYHGSGLDCSLLLCVQIRCADDGLWICITCDRSARSGQRPRLLLAPALVFPPVVNALIALNDIEERICSPRIVFMCIRPLGWDKQRGIIGNVVNVPVDVEHTLNQLPRQFTECETIQLKFMRRMDYNRPYMQDTVCRGKIVAALRFLVKSELFRQCQVTVSAEHLRLPETLAACTRTEPFIADVADTEPEEADVVLAEEVVVDNDDESDEDEDEEVFRETLLVQDEEMLEQAFRIAPAEGNRPIAIVSDPYKEPLTFLKLFSASFAFFKNMPADLTLAARCKSFFRRYDRRCASHTAYLFYMTKLLIASKMRQSINTCLRTMRTTRRLTAQDALLNAGDDLRSDLVRPDDVKQFLRVIRSSPEYWKQKTRQLFAMIRQLGSHRMLFMTFSPAELDWPELIVNLVWALEKRVVTVVQAEAMEREAKLELIRNDPVTTTRYLESRFKHLMNYALHPSAGPFGAYPIVDFFYRAEPHKKGSNHYHMVAFLGNIPNVDVHDRVADKRQLVEVIDRLMTVTCAHTENRRLLKYQRHRCKQNCMVDDVQFFDQEAEEEEAAADQQGDQEEEAMNLCDDDHDEDNDDEDDDEDGRPPAAARPRIVVVQCCKYGFPKPVLDETLILYPFRTQYNKNRPDAELEDREKALVAHGNYLIVRAVMVEMAKEQRARTKSGTPLDADAGVEEFLAESGCGLSYVEYIEAIRASIKLPTVFLKRNTNQMMINQFNEALLGRHRSNMDIQYIMDVGGVIAYVGSYMMKGNATMSRLLQVAADEVNRKANMSVREKLSHMANKFQNCSEFSAPWCAIHLLAMEVSHCSRENKFISTFRMEQRFTMLKDQAVLASMPANSTSIYVNSLFDYYVHRPAELEMCCLAKFASHYNCYTDEQYRRLTDQVTLTTSPAAASVRNLYPDPADDEDDDYEELVEEAAVVETSTTITDDDDNDDDVNLEDEEAERIERLQTPADRRRFMPVRPLNAWVREREGKCRIVSSVRYSKEKSRDEYYREQLLLYLPWRDERTEIEDLPNHFDKFEQFAGTIAENRRLFENAACEQQADGVEALERIAAEIEQERNLRAAHEARLLAEAHAQLMNPVPVITLDAAEDEENEEEALENQYGFHTDMEGPNLVRRDVSERERRQPCSELDLLAERAAPLMPVNELMRLLPSLNRMQFTFLLNMVRHVKNQMLGRRCRDSAISPDCRPTSAPVRAFVYGGTGKGKSYLIKCIYQVLTRLAVSLSPPSNDSSRRSTVVAAAAASVSNEAAMDDSVEMISMTPPLMRTAAADDENDEDDDNPNGVRVLICAFMWRAALEVNGISLHSAFGLSRERGSIDTNKDHSAVKRMRKQYKHLRVLIIDEISLVPNSLLSQVDMRLRQLFNTKEPFGGVNVIVVGDLKQLPPVQGPTVYARQFSRNAYTRLLPYATNRLWDLFRMIELTEFMRQQDDLSFARALDRLGNEGLMGLRRRQVAMFDSRIIRDDDDDDDEGNKTVEQLVEEQVPANATYICATNESVDRRNELVLKRMERALRVAADGGDGWRQQMFLNAAEDTVKATTEAGRVEAHALLRTVDNLSTAKTGGLVSRLRLVVGARYALTANYDIQDWLVNGMCGTLRRIVLNETGTHCEVMLMQFEHSAGERVGRNAREKFAAALLRRRRRHGDQDDVAHRLFAPYVEDVAERQWTPIFRRKEQIDFGKRSATWHALRVQFAAAPNQAMTVHKCQGQTCDYVAFDMSGTGLPRAMLYVLLSRVRRLVHLFLFGKVSVVAGQLFLTWSPARRREAIARTYRIDPMHVELDRLRSDAPFLNQMSLLDESVAPPTSSSGSRRRRRSLTVLFYKCDHLVSCMPMLRADFGVLACDVLVLFGTSSSNRPTTSRESLTFPGYGSFHRVHGGRTVRPSPTKPVSFLGRMIDDDDDDDEAVAITEEHTLATVHVRDSVQTSRLGDMRDMCCTREGFLFGWFGFTTTTATATVSNCVVFMSNESESGAALNMQCWHKLDAYMASNGLSVNAAGDAGGRPAQRLFVYAHMACEEGAAEAAQYTLFLDDLHRWLERPTGWRLVSMETMTHNTDRLLNDGSTRTELLLTNVRGHESERNNECLRSFLYESLLSPYRPLGLVFTDDHDDHDIITIS